MRMPSLSVLAAALAAAIPATPAFAQSDPLVMSGSNVDVMTSSQAEARMAELEEAYNSVKLAGPRAGVGISSILLPGGAFMLGAGIGIRNFESTFFCPPETPRCGDPGPEGLALAMSGVVAMVAGITGVILSSRKLIRKKKERERIQREINRLERPMPSD